MSCGPRERFNPLTTHDLIAIPRIFDFVRSELGATSKVKILLYSFRPATRCFRCANIFRKRSSKVSTSIRPTLLFAGSVKEVAGRQYFIHDCKLHHGRTVRPLRCNLLHGRAAHGSLGLPGVSRCGPSHPLRRFCSRDCRFRTLPEARQKLGDPPQQFPFVRRRSRTCFRDDLAVAASLKNTAVRTRQSIAARANLSRHRLSEKA